MPLRCLTVLLVTLYVPDRLRDSYRLPGVGRRPPLETARRDRILGDSRAVPVADPFPDPSSLEDGRLDELAARYGVRIATVRRWATIDRRPVDHDAIIELYVSGLTGEEVARHAAPIPTDPGQAGARRSAQDTTPDGVSRTVRMLVGGGVADVPAPFRADSRTVGHGGIVAEALVEPRSLAHLVVTFCEVGCVAGGVGVEPGGEFEVAVLLV
jgi:hypothetical protein